VSDFLLKGAAGLVGALATTASLVAVGSAVQWTRFRATHLPADQAVAALAREEVLVTGAAALVVFVLIALAVVLCVYVVDPKGTKGLGTASVLSIAALAGLLYAWLATDISVRGLLLLLLVAFACIALDLGVASSTATQFRWFGCAVFVSVLVFSSVLATLKSYREPRVQAAAILRGPQDRGLSGLYVARNDKRLYLGRPGEAALYIYPCKDITALAIGPPRAPDDAEAEGAPLRTALLDARSRARGFDLPTADQQPQEDAATETAKAGGELPTSSPIC